MISGTTQGTSNQKQIVGKTSNAVYVVYTLNSNCLLHASYFIELQQNKYTESQLCQFFYQHSVQRQVLVII